MTSIRLPIAGEPAPYKVAQVIGLGLTGVLLAGLIVRPTLSLHILWDMVIPFLPAVFLIDPMLWRNVCPLATINAYTGRRGLARHIHRQDLRLAWAVGIVLLAVMVPARRFLFNVDGPALAATIVAVAVLAAVAGIWFERRVAFCNGICPVLPVEKLYGQSPLVRVGTARCADCTVCTGVGCLDLAGDKAVLQTLGEARRDSRWITSVFGAFALAFPGFVVGYFTTENGLLATAPAVYLHVALWSLGSFVLLGGIAKLTGVSSRVALPLLGALAIALYYWFAAPKLASAFGGGTVAMWVVRALAFTLVAVWLWHWRGSRRTGPVAAPGVAPNRGVSGRQ